MHTQPHMDPSDKTVQQMIATVHKWLTTYKYCSHSDVEYGVNPDCVDLVHEIIREVYLPW